MSTSINHTDYEKLNPKEISYFSFNGKCFWCRIVKVYDGDSLTGIIKFENTFYKISIRLNGIDASEMRNSNDFLKTKAVACKERLANLIDFKDSATNCMVWIACYKNDKYGRVLADVYKSPTGCGVRIQDILVNEKMAYVYEGGTKKILAEQVEYFRDF